MVNYLWRKEDHRNRHGRMMSGRDYCIYHPSNHERRNREVEGYDRSPSVGNTLVHVRGFLIVYSRRIY